MKENPVCHDKRNCFGKRAGRCQILSETYLFDGDCPFCKELRDDKTQNTIKEK